MKLFSFLFLGLTSAKPEDRLATLESKLERLEHLITSLDNGRDDECNRSVRVKQLK